MRSLIDIMPLYRGSFKFTNSCLDFNSCKSNERYNIQNGCSFKPIITKSKWKKKDNNNRPSTCKHRSYAWRTDLIPMVFVKLKFLIEIQRHASECYVNFRILRFVSMRCVFYLKWRPSLPSRWWIRTVDTKVKRRNNWTMIMMMKICKSLFERDTNENQERQERFEKHVESWSCDARATFFFSSLSSSSSSWFKWIVWHHAIGTRFVF